MSWWLSIFISAALTQGSCRGDVSCHAWNVLTGGPSMPAAHPAAEELLDPGGWGVQVYMARWNGVQVVAVKQLLQATTDKAKMDFLREVLQASIKPCPVCGWLAYPS